MSYIDIAVIVLLGISFIFGFAGKAPRKIFSFLFMVIAVLVAYFMLDKFIDLVSATPASVIPINIGQLEGDTISVFIERTVKNLIESTGLSIPEDSANALVSGFVKMACFWVLALGCLIAIPLVGNLLTLIIFARRPKRTAFKTVGIFGLLKGAITVIVLFFPIMVLTPVLKTATSFDSSEEGNDPKFAMIEEQAQSSYFLNFADQALSSTKIKPLLYVKEGDTEERYLYDDIKSVPSLLKLASVMQSGSSDSSQDVFETFAALEDDEIREIFSNLDNSETVKEMVSSVIDDIIPEANIDLTDVDLSNEAEIFIAVKDLAVDVKEGEEISAETIEKFTDAAVDSELVLAVAEANPGLLKDVPDTYVDQISASLESKIGTEGFSQEDYDRIMKLFEE